VTDLPEAFKSQMQTQLGPATNNFLRALGEPSPVSIRFNREKYLPEGGNPVPWCETGQYLGQRPSFTLDPLFHAGAYYVQEASSMFLEQAVRQTVDCNAPQLALDLCAAPGGKTTHLLSLLSRDSLVVSNEVIRGRTNALIENVEKWGFPNTIVTRSDAADFARLESCFDLIVVDAPCSGEGLFRKDPDAAKEWSLAHVEMCALRQRRIVADVWDSLRPGGVLFYSTCTYNDQENQGTLLWLKEKHDCSFERLRFDPAWGVAEIEADTVIGYQCLPHRVRGEGFFVAAIRKGGQSVRRHPRTRDRLQYPSPANLGAVQPWIKNPTAYFFFLHGEQLRMLPVSYRETLSLLLDHVHVVQAGTGVGEVKKNKIVPDHALALSIVRNPQAMPTLEAAVDQALAYLRMETLPFQAAPGFHVVTFKELGLGWVNILPGRVNTLFPTSRRVRMTDR